MQNVSRNRACRVNTTETVVSCRDPASSVSLGLVNRKRDAYRREVPPVRESARGRFAQGRRRGCEPLSIFRLRGIYTVSISVCLARSTGEEEGRWRSR